MNDLVALDLDVLPCYKSSNYRHFHSGERHVTRICEEYVLLMMFDGTLTFIENGVDIALSAGEWYIQRPGAQTFSRTPCANPSYYYIHFYGETAVHASCGMALRGKMSVSVMENLAAKLHEATRDPTASRTKIHCALYDLLLTLASAGQADEESVMAHRILSSLQRYAAQPLSMKALGAQFGYHPDHIARIFKKTYGITPCRFVCRLRLDRAQTLLATSDRGVDRIAADCGYSAPSLFYRAFVKAYGLSPQQYRKQFRQG